MTVWNVGVYFVATTGDGRLINGNRAEPFDLNATG